MNKEYLEALERLAMPDDLHIKECKKLGIGLTEDYDILKQYFESIDNANPSEALKVLNCNPIIREEMDYEDYYTIKQSLLKSQEQEKENELLKEIIKSFFDKGCPLHQYTDNKGILQIEVDDECSNMRLGEFKGVDLDDKLKEVLECQKN